MKEQFFQKIKTIETESQAIQEDSAVKTELLVFLKNQMANVQSKNDLKLAVTAELMKRIIEEKDTISTATLIKLMEVLDNTENEKVGNILAVLKQQVIFQQNNLVPPAGGAVPLPEEQQVSKDDYQKAKKVYELVEKLKQSESNISGN